MKWEELGQRVANLYAKVAVWVYDNPVETDLLIGLVVVGSCAWYWRRQRRLRSKAFKIIRGALMKRKDREKYHLMMFEDAISEKAMGMVDKGDMSEAEEKGWYEFFATNFGMTGLSPVHNAASIRTGIKFRLLIGIHKRFVDIPGPAPGEGIRLDTTYKPIIEEIEGRRMSSMSRYLNGG